MMPRRPPRSIPLRIATLLFIFTAPATTVLAQAAAPPSPTPEPPAWTFRAAAAAYFIEEDDDYLQPTVTADRGGLHLEGRYNYEAQKSVSGFIGWNLAFGRTVQVQVTPMFGGVTGDTDGVIPAAELSVSVWRLEFYSEGEYVFDLERKRDRFFYNWSEVSIWPTDWLRAGVVTQRTRAYQSEREIQRGLFGGVAIGRIEATAYFFNPDDDGARVFVVAGVVGF